MFLKRLWSYKGVINMINASIAIREYDGFEDIESPDSLDWIVIKE